MLSSHIHPERYPPAQRLTQQLQAMREEQHSAFNSDAYGDGNITDFEPMSKASMRSALSPVMAMKHKVMQDRDRLQQGVYILTAKKVHKEVETKQLETEHVEVRSF